MAKMTKAELKRTLEAGNTVRFTFGENRDCYWYTLIGGKLCLKHIADEITDAAWFGTTWVNMAYEYKQAFVLEVVPAPSKKIEVVEHSAGLRARVDTLPLARHGNLQLLESGHLNLDFDGQLVATLTADKARRLATAILLLLDTANQMVTKVT